MQLHPKSHKEEYGASSHWIQLVYGHYCSSQQRRKEIKMNKEKRENGTRNNKHQWSTHEQTFVTRRQIKDEDKCH